MKQSRFLFHEIQGNYLGLLKFLYYKYLKTWDVLPLHKYSLILHQPFLNHILEQGQDGQLSWRCFHPFSQLQPQGHLDIGVKLTGIERERPARPGSWAESAVL